MFFPFLGGFTVGILMGMLVAPMRPMATPRVKIITWILRVVALVLLIVLFVVTIRELYSVYDPSTVRTRKEKKDNLSFFFLL